MKKLCCILIALFLITLSHSSLYAQIGSFGVMSAKTTGLAGAGVALNEKLMTLNLNPSNLVNRSDTSFNLSFILPDVSINAFSNSLSMEDLNKYFGSEDNYWDDADKKYILSTFENNGSYIIDAYINSFSICISPSQAIGSFAFSINDYIYSSLTVPKDVVSLLLFGNEINRNYSFSEMEMQSHWLRSYSLSYARNFINDTIASIRSLNIGISAKYYQGLIYNVLETETGSIVTNEQHTIEGRYKAKAKSAFAQGLEDFNPYNNMKSKEDIGFFPEPAGSGFGFDIGANMQFTDNLNLAISVTDIGSISWNEDYTEETTLQLNFNLVDVLDEKKIDSLVDGLDKKTEKIAAFSTTLPTALRIGAAYNLSNAVKLLPGEFIVLFDYHQGFTDIAANSFTPRAALAFDWKIGTYLPEILLGVTNHKTGKINMSTGIAYSLPFLDMYFSTYDIISLIEFQKHASFAVGLNWKVL